LYSGLELGVVEVAPGSVARAGKEVAPATLDGEGTFISNSLVNIF
jgi:hypothetical protein